MAYEPSRIEPKWQAYWEKHATFRAEIDTSKPKYYVLDMFPYPSGDGQDQRGRTPPSSWSTSGGT